MEIGNLLEAVALTALRALKKSGSEIMKFKISSADHEIYGRNNMYIYEPSLWCSRDNVATFLGTICRTYVHRE
jgi:hypothetical protein